MNSELLEDQSDLSPEQSVLAYCWWWRTVYKVTSSVLRLTPARLELLPLILRLFLTSIRKVMLLMWFPDRSSFPKNQSQARAQSDYSHRRVQYRDERSSADDNSPPDSGSLWDRRWGWSRWWGDWCPLIRLGRVELLQRPGLWLRSEDQD